eukprot:CAMPEP_0202899736 /NCGR_PEP_ID=MMETSP1392-20130828/7882_1 /ASSEMBLY_ACC=CAM_ASM_000868 /TAXON_ID=225041 /ORGANISM="Chlamydomonas chlamydogama, Strain SAG 11-48b" /LENGTH=137 /DNA_ID=CAMNT_0049585991 /DNA_START=50 /DNA_END=463 /DNA_ORIENTATION=-
MISLRASSAVTGPRTSRPSGSRIVNQPLQRTVVVPRASSEQTPANVCSTCGVDLSKAQKGCDGQGRVLGGLGSVPGFGWWPIKAYRPCPELSNKGIEYVRKGQATNDVLFGGVSLGQSGVKSLDEMRKTAEKGIKVE